jgi:adenine-specific DNA-methyltransferase
MTRAQAKKQLAELVSKFESNLAFYKSDRFNEANTRQQFLNPFWRAFGWNLDDFNEVELEYDVPIGNREHLKYADYVFKINGRPAFIVEAKKPATDLKNADVVFQVKRYGYNLQTVNFAVLTDFEEFRVFDCGIEPIYKNPQRGLLTQFDLLFSQYLENFDLLYDTFSREAVASGSLDKLLPKARQKAKQRIPVDKAFLKDLCEWRAQLAKDVAKKNPFDDYELNEAVQLLIDRVIFMRVVEDRQIEATELVLDALNRWQREKEKPFYQYLADKFRWMAPQYNGLLFKSSPYDDMLVDDRILQRFVESLYYPNSPYQFNIIGVELLGNIYEQFLGSTITVKETPKRRIAQVEPKPEVRKAGGVYYTPKYIVDYIVDQTVGKVIAGKTPKEIEKIRVLDPACGSGSFLIGAFEKLIKYHQDYYAKRDKQNKLTRKEAMQDYDRKTGQLRLYRKIRILKNNIFGVDIDHQAVEVTILSLYLKLLEGDQSLFLIKQSILPDMSDNIRCGNSLIGPDFYEGKQLTLDKAEERRINVFDWHSKTTGFGHIMEQGGFDCVIGNPPYGAEFSHDIRHFLSRKYQVPVPITDSFVLFLIKALNLIRIGGRQAFILPSTWLYMPSYVDLRKLLLTNIIVDQVVLFRSPVFKKVTVETCIEVVINKKATDTRIQFKEVSDKPSSFGGSVEYLSQDQILAQKESNLYQSKYGSAQALFERLSDENPSLGDLTTIICGLTPYRRGKGEPPQSQHVVKNRVFDADLKKDITYRQYIMGRDFHRYTWQLQDERWISYGDWLAEPRYKAPFNDPVKIVVRQTADSIIANIDTNQYLSLKNVHNLRVTDNRLSYPYLLGLLNSKLVSWWYHGLIPETGRVFAEVKVVNLKKLPIRTINFDDPVEKNKHDRLVELVETMLDLHKKLQAARTETDKRRIQTRIEHTDHQIDQLVYKLYALTEEEIKIVEGKK